MANGVNGGSVNAHIVCGEHDTNDEDIQIPCEPYTDCFYHAPHREGKHFAEQCEVIIPAWFPTGLPCEDDGIYQALCNHADYQGPVTPCQICQWDGYENRNHNAGYSYLKERTEVKFASKERSLNA